MLLVHIYLMSLHGGFLPAFPTTLELAASSLGNGVALFFIISGFVIPASLFRHRDVTRFLMDRFLRIMPVFLAIHLIVFAMGPFIGYKWLHGIGLLRYVMLFAANMTFTALPLGLPLAQQNSWTLTYEWGFYIVTSAAWLALAARKRNWLACTPVALGTVAFCAAYPICFYFVVGIMFSLVPRKRRIAPAVECILVPLCLMAFFYCAEFVNYIAALPPSLIFFWAVLQDGSVTSRLLCTKLLQYLGKISYSLYLVHPLAMFPLQFVGAHLASKGANVSVLFGIFAFLGVLSTVGISAISYTWLEVRFRERIANLLAARSLPPASVQ